MATGLLNANASSVTLECNGVTAMIAKDTGVLAAGAPGVSGNDVATVGQLGLSKYYESLEQVITNGGTLTLNHGMGAAPKLVNVSIVCKVIDLGYAVGTELYLGSRQDHSTAAYGFNTRPAGATHITLKIGTSGIYLHGSDGTSAALVITPANWRLIVRAWA